MSPNVRVPRAGLEASRENTGFDGVAKQNRSLLAENSDFLSRYEHFTSLLREWEFTSDQIHLIGDAMREAGLEVVERVE